MLLQLALFALAVQDPAPVRLVRANLAGLEREELVRLELDVASHEGAVVPGRLTDVLATGVDLERLRALGVPHKVLIEDLVAHYQSRLVPGGVQELGTYGAWLTPAFGQGSMGGYYTFTEMESVLDQIAAAYPALTFKTNIGSSIENRQLWMVKVSDNPGIDEDEPESRFDALHHAREPMGMHATLWFLLWLVESYGSDPLATHLVDQREIYFVPCVNPDGYAYNEQTNPSGGGNWRKNRRQNPGGSVGVDLNRNYTAFWGWDNVGSSGSQSSSTYRGSGPGSEPEVNTMETFISARDFRTALSSHSYGNLWLSAYGYAAVEPANQDEHDEIAGRATAINRHWRGPFSTHLYIGNGIINDFDYQMNDVMSWTPEIGSPSQGFWPPTERIIPLAEKNLLAFARTAQGAGAFLHDPQLIPAELPPGNGFIEAGESASWPLTLRNGGRGPTTTPVTVTVISPTSNFPNAAVGVQTEVFPVIPSFSEVSSTAPVRIDVAPNAPEGTVIDFTLTVTHGGYTTTHSSSFVVGEARPVLLDELENDHGWTVSSTANDGQWVRGDPIGTFSGPEPVNPAEDTTAAPGVMCWMTGNGGGNAASDDVDNGSTTLRSPVFDLSAVKTATLTYSRWYADLSPTDDWFETDVSNDAGASWTALENLTTNENAWTTMSFELHDLLPLTDRMQLRFVADDEANSLVEAAIDDVTVLTRDPDPILHFYGDAQAGTLQLNLSGRPGAHYVLAVAPFGASAKTGGVGSLGGPAWRRVPLTGVLPPSGLEQLTYTVPNASGATYRYRAVTRLGQEVRRSNELSLNLP
jgi:hypothetical protein